MPDESSNKGIWISILIGAVLAGLYFWIMYSMADRGEQAMGPALVLYLLLGTLGSFAAGWMSRILGGQDEWLLKGSLACPVIYLFIVGLIGTVVTGAGDADVYIQSWGVALLVSVLFSILGAAGANFLRTKYENEQSEGSQDQGSRSD